MPLGPGHSAYGRWAKGVGTNPASIAAKVLDEVSGHPLWNLTLVRIYKAEEVIWMAQVDKEKTGRGLRRLIIAAMAGLTAMLASLPIRKSWHKRKKQRANWKGMGKQSANGVWTLTLTNALVVGRALWLVRFETT
ncbi:MAG: hypothetical protein ACUVTP_12035 [Candidatus Fervidibacter sp.]|uniref:hypothetical protein n=1 Tax=Candidatus Fervidibacter sp. TaxID=3100871 RepID=UPI004049C9B1